MISYLIVNANIVNEGTVTKQDVFIRNGRIEKIGKQLDIAADHTIDAKGKYLMPGVIDDQVHFREPGLTHKATIKSEARAAVAGGITSFMEMPNTNPQTLTQELLQQKYDIASRDSLANYSFFMGASNDNIEEVLKTNAKEVCGVKVFMGSSTGNMLVDNEKTLENLFSKVDMLIATHCEDEATIRANTEKYSHLPESEITAKLHPVIRDVDACYISSSMAVDLAKKHNTRLHILHISTGKETSLFSNQLPLSEKKITAEACIHHLWFSDRDYAKKGNFIKWNPAVKSEDDKESIWEAVLDGRIDVIATDHAPHTLEEKSQHYWKAPSGGPLVQHALPAMLEMHHQGRISLEMIVQKMCHNPAILFQIQERGYIREGYWADIVLFDINDVWKVEKSNILSKCNWSPFENDYFLSKITHTFVSGYLAYENGVLYEDQQGKRLAFNR